MACKLPTAGAETQVALFNSIRVGRGAPIAAINRLLLTTPWFAALSLDNRQALINIAEQRDLRRGEYLWRQGDEGRSVCVPLFGLLEDFEEDAEGRRTFTVVLGPGAWFGALTALANLNRRANIRALGPAKILEIPGEPLLALLRARPELYPHFVRLIALCMEPSMIQVRARALKGPHRLYRLLLELCAGQERAAPGVAFHFPLSQQVAADATGMTRIRVAQLIAALRHEGIVETSYAGIEVLDLVRLKALAAASHQAHAAPQGEYDNRGADAPAKVGIGV